MTQYTFSEMAKSKLYSNKQAIACDLRRRDAHNNMIITNQLTRVSFCKQLICDWYIPYISMGCNCSYMPQLKT